MSAVRDALDDECRECGLSIKLAHEVCPVVHGKAISGRWLCGDCIKLVEGRDLQ